MNRMIELTPRLSMVANMVPKGARLADVGTDHAYLPAALIQSGRISQAIAADLREGPLSRARQTVQACGLTEHIALRLCDGLMGIRPEEVDAVAIAGMGGETIAAILQQAPWIGTRGVELVLQPMSTMYELRRWLCGHGYWIEKEELAREGETLYTAWLVKAGDMDPMNEAELWAGKNTAHPLRGAWLDLWIGKVARALEGVTHSQQARAAERREELRDVYEGLVHMKKEWNAWQ